MTDTVADVAVVGGGPAGAATAIALRRTGVERVVLVDAGDPASAGVGDRIGESIPPDTRLLFRDLGLLEAFLEEGHLPSRGSCSAWGSPVLGHHDAIVSPHGHGWHLDRQRFDRWLLAAAVDQGVQVHPHTRFRGLRQGAADRPIRLRVTADRSPVSTVACRFVVDATGRRSVLARRLGARRRVEASLVCVAGWLDGTDWASSLTMLEAVPYGWWYLARVPDGRVAVLVASDGPGIRERGLADPDGWRQALAATNHVGPAVAAGRLHAGRVRASVAPVSLLDPPAGPGWLAVGDAAIAHDPVAARGIHTALAGGIHAAGAIGRWLGGDPGGLVDHGVDQVQGFLAHLRQRDQLYALEQRWPTAGFWQRRGTRLAPATRDVPPSSGDASSRVRTAVG